MASLVRFFVNPPALSALLALLVFAITLNGVFIYDDVAVIEKDRRIADPSLWGEYWTDSYNFGADNLYRPLVSMSYAVQHFLHGPRPMPFHLVNWLLHALASALVAVLAMRLAERLDVDRPRAIGFTAGVLFAVHPVHVEAIANVVGRAELMCAVGVIGAMLLFLKPLSPPRVAGIVACFLLALLSKEQGMLVPLLLGIVALAMSDRLRHWARRPFSSKAISPQPHAAAFPCIGIERQDKDKNAAAILFVLLALTLAGYVIYRESILKFWWDRSFLDTWTQPLSAPDVTARDRMLVPITIAGRYLQLLVAPVTLRLDYGGDIVPGRFDARDPFFSLGVLALALWIALVVLAIRQRDRYSLLCLFCFAFVYGLLGNIVTLIGVNMAERLMYLPSVIFVLLVAGWITRLNTRVAATLLVSIALLYSARSFTYAARWNDRLAFYLYAAEVEPRSLKSLHLAAEESLDRGDLSTAEMLARRAIALRPGRDDVYLRLARVKIAQGELDEAQALILKAQGMNPPGAWTAFQAMLDAKRATTMPARK